MTLVSQMRAPRRPSDRWIVPLDAGGLPPLASGMKSKCVRADVVFFHEPGPTRPGREASCAASRPNHVEEVRRHSFEPHFKARVTESSLPRAGVLPNTCGSGSGSMGLRTLRAAIQ